MLPVVCQRTCVPDDEDWIIFLIGRTKFWADPLGIWLKSLWRSPKCVFWWHGASASLQVLFCISNSTPTAPAVVTSKRFLGCVFEAHSAGHDRGGEKWGRAAGSRHRSAARRSLYITDVSERYIVCQGILPRRLRLLLGHRGGMWKVSASSDRAPSGKDKQKWGAPLIYGWDAGGILGHTGHEYEWVCIK